MDILVSSNFERFLYYLLLGDARQSNPSPIQNDDSKASFQLTHLLNQLKVDGGFSVEKEVLDRARSVFGSSSISDEDTLDCIKRYYHSKEIYLIDPHTAVGIVAYENMPKENVVSVCLATASAGKFPEFVLKALNECAEGQKENFKKVLFEDIADKVLVGLKFLPKRCWSISTNGVKETGAGQVKEIIERACRK